MSNHNATPDDAHAPLPAPSHSGVVARGRAVCILLGDSSDASWVGFADGSVERLEPVPPGAGQGVDGVVTEKADRVSGAFVQQIGLKDIDAGGLVLGLPSSWCFALRLPPRPATGRKALRNRRLAEATALRFRAEPLLPVDAESLAVALVEVSARGSAEPASHGGAEERGEDVFLVATDASRAGAEVAALEAAGVAVTGVCATSLLAAAGPAGEGADDAGELVISGPDCTERISLLDGKPCGWSFHRGSPGAERDPAAPLNTEQAARRAGAAVVRLRKRGRFPLDLAAGPLGVREVATGFDLRRGAMSRGRWRELRRPLGAVAVAAGVLLVACLLALQVQVTRAGAAAAEHDRAAEAAFRGVFPGQAVPAALLSRLRSEARAAGVLPGGGGDPASKAPPRPSALRGLEAAMKAIPADLRIELDEVRVETERVVLEGRVLTPGDADRLAAGLRVVGLTPQPPRTQALPTGRGVGFTLQAERPSGEAQDQAEGRP